MLRDMKTPSPTHQGSSAPTAPASTPDPRRWLVLAVASAAQFLAVLDAIAVNIAFPVIGRDFSSASTAELSWVLNAYTVVLAALLIPAGRVADETGRRRSFLLGLGLFGLASVGCAAAPGLEWLIAARVLQGVGAAVLVPTSLSLALPAFPARERATAVGIWTAVSAVAAGSGPVFGGLLAASDWRLIFLINVPVVAVAIPAGLRLLPRAARGARHGLDLTGTALVFAAIGCLVTAFSEAEDWGAAAPGTLGLLAAGALAAVLCALHVRRAAEPVVHPELFRTRGFTPAAVGLLSYFLGFAAMTLSATELFTAVWGYSIQRAGLAIAPWPGTVLLVSVLSGRLVRTLGERAAAVVGAAAFAAAPLWWLLAAGGRSHYATDFLPGLICAGIGTGLYQSVMFAAAGRLPEHRMSSGSGVLMVSRQGGTALGVAVLVALGGGAHHPALGSLRHGWLFAVITSALALLAALTFGRGTRGVHD